MRGRPSSIKIELTSEQQYVLSSWLRRQKTPVGLAKRARAMLLLSDGQTFTQTSLQVGLGERHLRKDCEFNKIHIYDTCGFAV